MTEPAVTEPAVTSLIAPDGSPVEVFATFPPGAALAHIGSAIEAVRQVLDLGCGAGRIACALAEQGHAVVGVDESAAMIAAMRDRGAVEGVVARIEDLNLGRRFDVVLLASYLVNTPDPGRRAAFLATCRRHVVADGVVLIQRHQPEFLASATDERSGEDGFEHHYERLRALDDVVTARMTYVHGDHRWEQEFTAAILTEEHLVNALDEAGLRFLRWLDEFETWAEAVPA